METNYKGGSRLHKIVTKEHMKPHICDLMVFLHQAKGFSDILLFEDWMHHYIDIILTGKHFLDWSKLIASSLRNQLKHSEISREEFYMSS